MQYYVYIMSTDNNKVIYVGVTNDLLRRVYEHKHGMDKSGFTAQYNVHKLVYYEVTTTADSAISREKQLKSWSRKKKDKLIEGRNPQWRELYDELMI